MHTKSNNIEITIGSDTNEVIESLSRSLLRRYQKNLEEKTRDLEFIFDGINLLH